MACFLGGHASYSHSGEQRQAPSLRHRVQAVATVFGQVPPQTTDLLWLLNMKSETVPFFDPMTAFHLRSLGENGEVPTNSWGFLETGALRLRRVFFRFCQPVDIEAAELARLVEAGKRCPTFSVLFCTEKSEEHNFGCFIF